MPNAQGESAVGSNNAPVVPNGPADRLFDVDIASFTGHATFLDMLLKVKPVDVDQDYGRVFQVIGGAAYLATLKSDFDPGVLRKIVGYFADDESRLQQAIDSIQGQSTTPGTVFDLIVKAISGTPGASKAAEVISPTLALASNMGTTLHFGDVIVKEVGYAGPSANLPPNVKPEMTGRGYSGEPPARKLLDASDAFYLAEIKNIFRPASTDNPRLFLAAVFDVLTQCGVSEIAALDGAALTGVGDFLAVYFAEAARNAMSDLKQHAWQKDLLHATCLGSYVAGAGGDPGVFWAKGPSGRSGIGETRAARHMLAEQACNAAAKIDPSGFNALQNRIGGAVTVYGGDLFQQMADYLNDPNSSESVLKDANDIAEAATNFIAGIHDNAPAILKSGVAWNITV